MDQALSFCEQARQYQMSKDYELSLSLYTKGIQSLMTILEAVKDSNHKAEIRELITAHLDNAEKVKSSIAEMKVQPSNCNQPNLLFASKNLKVVLAHLNVDILCGGESILIARDKHTTDVMQVKITDGSTGYDYHVIFDRCLDDSITSVEIDDPYIRNPHQVRNLVRVSELLLRKTKVKYIKLVTGQEAENEKRNKQHGHLEELRISLQMHNVTFTLSFSDTLHSREIRFNNGWKVIIDRGLDYFKPFKSQFAIGYFDFNLRACKETSVTYMKDTG